MAPRSPPGRSGFPSARWQCGRPRIRGRSPAAPGTRRREFSARRSRGSSDHLQLVQTIVTGFAGGLFIILVEIFRQNLVSAMRLGAEMIEALEFVQHDLLLGRILQQGPPGEIIAPPIEHDSNTREGRLGRPGRSPGDSARCFWAWPYGSHSGYWSGRCPCRRRWWPP